MFPQPPVTRIFMIFLCEFAVESGFSSYWMQYRPVSGSVIQFILMDAIFSAKKETWKGRKWYGLRVLAGFDFLHPFVIEVIGRSFREKAGSMSVSSGIEDFVSGTKASVGDLWFRKQDTVTYLRSIPVFLKTDSGEWDRVKSVVSGRHGNSGRLSPQITIKSH